MKRTVPSSDSKNWIIFRQSFIVLNSDYISKSDGVGCSGGDEGGAGLIRSFV